MLKQAPDCTERVEDFAAIWYEYPAEGADPFVASPQPRITCSDGRRHSASYPHDIATFLSAFVSHAVCFIAHIFALRWLIDVAGARPAKP